MPRRHFTLEEAAQTLREAAPLAARLVAQYRQLREAEAELAPLRARITSNGGDLDRSRYRQLERASAQASAAIDDALGRLETLGLQVKDLERGLLDFPTVHPVSGETVLLCWQVGETEIAHWHGLDEGYAGRKPLPF